MARIHNGIIKYRNKKYRKVGKHETIIKGALFSYDSHAKKGNTGVLNPVLSSSIIGNAPKTLHPNISFYNPVEETNLKSFVPPKLKPKIKYPKIIVMP
jgi:hypothetical protein